MLGVGLSFVDAEHAAQDLAAEAPNLDFDAPNLDFDAVQAEAESTWEAHLARVELHGPSKQDFEIFYSALCHFSCPPLASDIDSSYCGLDPARVVAGIDRLDARTTRQVFPDGLHIHSGGPA